MATVNTWKENFSKLLDAYIYLLTKKVIFQVKKMFGSSLAMSLFP